MSLYLDLPWPPSGNRSVRTGMGRHYTPKDVLAYRKAVWAIWKQQKLPTQAGDLSLWAALYPPNKRRRDLDNCGKVLLDALQHAGAFENDYQIVDLRLTRLGVERRGSVYICIRGINEPAPWR